MIYPLRNQILFETYSYLCVARESEITFSVKEIGVLKHFSFPLDILDDLHKQRQRYSDSISENRLVKKMLFEMWRMI